MKIEVFRNTIKIDGIIVVEQVLKAFKLNIIKKHVAQEYFFKKYNFKSDEIEKFDNFVLEDLVSTNIISTSTVSRSENFYTVFKSILNAYKTGDFYQSRISQIDNGLYINEVIIDKEIISVFGLELKPNNGEMTFYSAKKNTYYSLTSQKILKKIFNLDSEYNHFKYLSSIKKYNLTHL